MKRAGTRNMCLFFCLVLWVLSWYRNAVICGEKIFTNRDGVTQKGLSHKMKITKLSSLCFAYCSQEKIFLFPKALQLSKSPKQFTIATIINIKKANRVALIRSVSDDNTCLSNLKKLFGPFPGGGGYSRKFWIGVYRQGS